MKSLLNKKRPPLLCPGCGHEKVVLSLNEAFILLGLSGKQIAIVSDIGCSGLFDTFFNTHAMHGLHGRALTYATGIKMANPKLNVIATMGDGGLGIGGAHFLAACRRNLNITLLVLNNFNFGMTGGQFSSTTPSNSQVGSSFLNRLEEPIDTCSVAKAAGASYVVKCSGYDQKLSQKMANAITYEGITVMDIHGICPGRYTKKNLLTPSIINEKLSKNITEDGEVKKNIRTEYSKNYKITSKAVKEQIFPPTINIEFEPLQKGRQEIIILGKAGQRIITAGEILCLAALTAGLSANQKNDYPITVLRGHSISNLVISTEEIGFTGITKPNIIIAIADEGIKKKINLFKNLTRETLVITDSKLEIPKCKAKIKKIDFKLHKIKSKNKAMVCLGILAETEKIINYSMLIKAIETRFNSKVINNTKELLERNKNLLELQ